MCAAMKRNFYEITGKQARGPKLLVKPLHTTSPSCCHLVAHPVGPGLPRRAGDHGQTPHCLLLACARCFPRARYRESVAHPTGESLPVVLSVALFPWLACSRSLFRIALLFRNAFLKNQDIAKGIAEPKSFRPP